MKAKHIFGWMLLMAIPLHGLSQTDLNKGKSGDIYQSQYRFTASISMEMSFYDKKGALREIIPYESIYTSDFRQFSLINKRGNAVYQSLFDIPRNYCLIIVGQGDQLMGSLALMKDNSSKLMKTLTLIPTEETKTIAGLLCSKFTFNVAEFSGEMWLSEEIDLSNEVGVFKVSKTSKYYQQLSAKGFVMEITSVTPKGKKTVITTTALEPSKETVIRIPDTFGTSLNTIDYYDY